VKTIIVGAGEVGFQIAQKLSEEKQDVILIEQNHEHVKRINDNLDVQAILGSGTSPEILKSSGIKDADLLVAVTDSDEVNLVACLLARILNQYILKIARIRNPEYIAEKALFGEDLLAVDQIINPESVMVETIRNLMMVPEASDVIEFAEGRVRLIGMTVKEDSPLAGRKLLSFQNMEEKILIGAIFRGDQVFIPHGDDTIHSNDLVYFVSSSAELDNIRRLFSMKEEALRRVLIVGGGQTGEGLANVLDKTKINTHIIEKDGTQCAYLAEKLKRVTVIHGDGTDKDLLQEVGTRDADFMVALTGDEESNVLISLLAKGLGAKKSITRVNKFSYIPLVSAIGIDTVVSTRLSAVRAILQYIRKGKIISVAPLKEGQAEVIEAEALETSDMVNTPLSDVKFPKGSLVGAIVRGHETIIPKGDTVILPKDRLIIFALRKMVHKLEKLLTVKLEFF
jgi:trk system potassium uptake protein TrkA